MKDLNEARLIINDIDDQMKLLFIKRMGIVKEIAKYKKENNMPIFDEKREKEMIERLSEDMGELKNYYLAFLNCVLIESKTFQESVIE